MSSAQMVIAARGGGSGRIDKAAEARKARHRLLPVSLVYTAYASLLLALALRSPRWATGLGFYALGFAVWTWVEYEVHRHILHGRFPDGPGLRRRLLHRAFDHLHWEHHARPWDGNHVNGTLKDTGPFVALFAALSFGIESAHPSLAWTATLFVAGIAQAYILEEWVHHSVHFHDFKGRYWRYIRRHHMYHHSPKGTQVGYGLTNGFWDVVYETRIPAHVRARLYAPAGLSEMRRLGGARQRPA
jgi:hypothetical protein